MRNDWIWMLTFGARRSVDILCIYWLFIYSIYLSQSLLHSQFPKWIFPKLNCFSMCMWILLPIVIYARWYFDRVESNIKLNGEEFLVHKIRFIVRAMKSHFQLPTLLSLAPNIVNKANGISKNEFDVNIVVKTML